MTSPSWRGPSWRRGAGTSSGFSRLATGLLPAGSQRSRAGVSATIAVGGGIVGLIVALSQELGPRGVTVNGIGTGWMDWTPGRGPDEIGANRLMRFVPMRRFGRADELGGLAVLLAPGAGGYLNGQVFHADGGVPTHI